MRNSPPIIFDLGGDVSTNTLIKVFLFFDILSNCINSSITSREQTIRPSPKYRQAMLKAYKYRIYPNSKQGLLIEKHFGCSRFVFNWALALQKRYYALFGKSLSRTQIQSQLVKKNSKICSHCHHKLDSLPLSVRNWMCPSCQVYHDRDTNAASNIRKQALADVAGLATV